MRQRTMMGFKEVSATTSTIRLYPRQRTMMGFKGGIAYAYYGGSSGVSEQ